MAIVDSEFLKLIKKAPASDVHGGDSQLESKTSPQTEADLDQMTPDELRSTRNSLDTVTQTLESNLSNEAKKKSSITKNLEDLADDSIKLPTNPAAGLLNSANKTISNGLRNMKSSDKQKVNEAGSVARESTPDPNAVSRFERAKASLVSGKISKRITDITKAIASVNAMKSAIDKKLG